MTAIELFVMAAFIAVVLGVAYVIKNADKEIF